MLAQLRQHVEAAEARHLDVEQHQVEGRLRQQRAAPRCRRRPWPRHSRAAAGASTGRRGWLRYRRRPGAKRGDSSDAATPCGQQAPRSSRAAARIESAWNRNRPPPAASAFSRSSVMACALRTMIGMWRVAASLLQLTGRLPAVDDRQAEVHQDQVRRLLARQRHRLLAVHRGQHAEPRRARRRLSASRLGSLSSTRRIVDMFASRESRLHHARCASAARRCDRPSRPAAAP